MKRKIEEVEFQAKKAVASWNDLIEASLQFYDSMFGYPAGRIIIWTIAWMTLCLMMVGIGVTHGF